MKNNMGNTDRIVRILIAILFVALYFTNTVSGTLGIVLLVIAGILTLTSLVNFCPLYKLLGIDTCPAEK